MRVEFENSLQFAKKMDRNDPMKKFRSRFHYPTVKGKSTIYFTGNSLGLQPKSAEKIIQQELKDWAQLGVEGHVRAKNPWIQYHKNFKKSLANLVGAHTDEVVAMNQLTVNLHLMMLSFYRPTKKRHKIITEAGAFPSDQYAVASQIRFHGFNPKKAWIELTPRKDEATLRTSDIIKTIKEHGNEVALVLLGGIQYYTGQLFDIKKITAATHSVGAVAGWDLAHAIGNVPLDLHKHQVDFAVWCSYKYLNSGPGSIAGVFIHQKHFNNKSIPRLEGWWGHSEEERFKMEKKFVPMHGADAWQLSTFTVMNAASHLASVSIFSEAKLPALRKKSELLTGYAEFLLNELDPKNEKIKILTPENPKERGCQLSIRILKGGKEIFTKLIKSGVIADWREPGVIRIAPAPLYNTFEEVFLFARRFKRALKGQ